MSLTPEQIEAAIAKTEYPKFVQWAKKSGGITNGEWFSWLACAESKQAEIDQLRAEKDADTILMQNLTARIRLLEKESQTGWENFYKARLALGELQYPNMSVFGIKAMESKV